MSTRCMIGVKMPDNTIKAIYCHHDGYPSGVGEVLRKYYTNPDEAEKLMKLGDLSVLGTWYDESLSKLSWDYFNMDEKKKEKYNALSKDMTITYKSRGEDGVDARTYDNVKKYLAEVADTWCDYFYLFTEDYTGVYRWHYVEVPYFKPLKDEEDE